MKKNFSLLILLTLSMQVMQSQWSHVGGPSGEGITSLTVNGEIVIAGGHSGVIYRSTDKGLLWTSIGQIPGSHVRLTDSDNILYAASEGGGVYRSTDNGNVWNDIGQQLPTRYITALGVQGSHIFVGTSNGVYHSTNDGTSWSQVNTGLADAYIISIVYGNTVLAIASGNHIAVSTDNGGSWSPASIGTDPANLLTLSIDQSVLYAGTGSSLYRSTNNGTDWVKIMPSISNIRCVLSSGNTIYVGSIGTGVHRSTDHGSTFMPLNTGMLNKNIRTMVVAGDVVLAGDYQDGVYRLESGSNTWSISNKGQRVTPLTVKAVSSQDQGKATIFAGARSESSGEYSTLIRSTDLGVTWKSLPTPTQMELSTPMAASGATVLMGGREGFAGVSVDSAESWTLMPIRMSGVVNDVHIRNTTWLAGFDWYGVYRSTDQGASWDTAHIPFQTYKSVYRIVSTNEKIFMCGREGFYRSLDDGKTWDKKSAGLPSFIAEQSMAMGAAQDTVFIAGSAGLYVSTNAGENWAQSSTGLPAGTVLSIVSFAGKFYTVVRQQGIFCSTDGGKSWSAFNEGLASFTFNSLAMVNNELIAANHQGLWKRHVGPTTDITTDAPFSPGQYSLGQNYPNPFNPSTTVPYHLKRAGMISIKIYDLLGKEVATLTEGYRDAGSYAVRWDAHGVSSGIYLMRMVTGTIAETKKIVLLR